MFLPAESKTTYWPRCLNCRQASKETFAGYDPEDHPACRWCGHCLDLGLPLDVTRAEPLSLSAPPDKWPYQFLLFRDAHKPQVKKAAEAGLVVHPVYDCALESLDSLTLLSTPCDIEYLCELVVRGRMAEMPGGGLLSDLDAATRAAALPWRAG